MINQILRPFAYLAVKNTGSKWIFDFAIPAALTVITATIVLLGNNFEINKIISENKIAAGIFDITKGLPGFFIAALAAIATFSQEKLDEKITNSKSIALTIKTKIIDQNGKSFIKDIELSRRVYLCMLFSYLTAISFAICAVYIFYFASGFISNHHPYTFAIFNLIITFIFWQIFICTLYGLFYLSDRIHQ